MTERTRRKIDVAKGHRRTGRNNDPVVELNDVDRLRNLTHFGVEH